MEKHTFMLSHCEMWSQNTPTVGSDILCWWSQGMRRNLAGGVARLLTSHLFQSQKLAASLQIEHWRSLRVVQSTVEQFVVLLWSRLSFTNVFMRLFLNFLPICCRFPRCPCMFDAHFQISKSNPTLLTVSSLCFISDHEADCDSREISSFHVFFSV